MRANITVQGRLTKDPEVKTDANGKAYTKFTVAYNDYRDKDDNGESRTDFWNVVYFGPKANDIASRLSKGNAVEVYGNPQLRRFTGDDGNERIYPSIIPDRYEGVLFLDNKPEAKMDSHSNNNRNNYGNNNNRNNNNQQQNNQSNAVEDDFEVPF